MNKYLSQAKPKPKIFTPSPKLLRCVSCGRDTKHDPANRVGVNGVLFVCRECGAERGVR